MSARTPAAGAGTSIVTLSVSSSTSGSSTATRSPGFLNHLPIVASVTDSPSVGTRMSVMFVSSLSPLSLCGRSSQRVFKDRLELREMLRHLADCGRGGGRPPRIGDLSVLGVDLLQHPLEIGLDELERAHITRLFLTPGKLRLFEAAKLMHQRTQRHRIELLDAQQ